MVYYDSMGNVIINRGACIVEIKISNVFGQKVTKNGIDRTFIKLKFSLMKL